MRTYLLPRPPLQSLTSLSSLEKLGDDISEGVLGYITIGIDSTASYSIMNNNYYNSSTESASASASASFASFN